MLLTKANLIDPAMVYVLCGAIVFVLQLFLFLKAKNIFIKLLPLFVSLLATITCFILLLLGEGWDQIGYLFLTIFSFGAFTLCGFCVLVSLLIKKLKAKKNPDDR